MFFGAPATHQNTTQEHTKPIKRQNRPHTKTIKQQNRSTSHTKKTTSKPEHQVRQNSKASTPATHQNNNLKRHDRSSSHSPKLQNDTTKVPATHKIDKTIKPVHQPHTKPTPATHKIDKTTKPMHQPHTKPTMFLYFLAGHPLRRTNIIYLKTFNFLLKFYVRIIHIIYLM